MEIPSEFYNALTTMNYAAKNMNEGRLKLGITQMRKAIRVLRKYD